MAPLLAFSMHCELDGMKRLRNTIIKMFVNSVLSIASMPANQKHI